MKRRWMLATAATLAVIVVVVFAFRGGTEPTDLEQSRAKLIGTIANSGRVSGRIVDVVQNRVVQPTNLNGQ